MIKASFPKTHSIIIAILFVSVVLSGYAVDNSFLQTVKETELSAYTDINNGKARDALQKIFELFRSAPENDIKSAEVLLEPLHLYCFIVNKFYQPETLIKQQLGQTKIVQEDQYPSDKLLVGIAFLYRRDVASLLSAGNRYSSLLSDSSLDGNQTLKFLADTIHAFATVSEENLQYNPQGFASSLLDVNKKLVNSLFLSKYPDSLSVQFLLQDLVNRSINTVISRYKNSDPKILVQTYIDNPNQLDLLRGVVESGVTADNLNLLRGIAKIRSVLLSMNLYDINEQTIQKWAEMLKEEEDSNTRYTLITFLKCGMIQNENSREIVKTALLNASLKKEITPDVLYAKFTLLDLATENYWVKEAEKCLSDILQLDVLPPLPGLTSVYEKQLNLIDKGIKFFVKLGYYDIAKRALEIQSGKFLQTNYNLGIKANLTKLENYPFEYSLEVISTTTPYIRTGTLSGDIFNDPINQELRRKYYDEIIHKTPDTKIKNYLTNHDITQPIKYNIDYGAVNNNTIQTMINEITAQQARQ